MCFESISISFLSISVSLPVNLVQQMQWAGNAMRRRHVAAGAKTGRHHSSRPLTVNKSHRASLISNQEVSISVCAQFYLRLARIAALHGGAPQGDAPVGAGGLAMAANSDLMAHPATAAGAVSPLQLLLTSATPTIVLCLLGAVGAAMSRKVRAAVDAATPCCCRCHGLRLHLKSPSVCRRRRVS